MASNQKLLKFYITSFLCFLSLSSSHKVTLRLYYEALCPYCADFIVNHLPNILETGLISAIDLQLVPWGNAAIRADGTTLCQNYQNFVMYVCDAYESNYLPEACKILNQSMETLSRFNSSVEKLTNSPQVCYSNTNI